MAESPRNLGPEIEEGTMLPEQEEASQLREKRIRILGKEGKMWSPTPEKPNTEILRGQARGHNIQLKQETFEDGTKKVHKYSGEVDGAEIDADTAGQLYERYVGLLNFHEEEAAKKAVEAQTRFHEEGLAREKKKVEAGIIEELLRDDPEHP